MYKFMAQNSKVYKNLLKNIILSSLVLPVVFFSNTIYYNQKVPLERKYLNSSRDSYVHNIEESDGIFRRRGIIFEEENPIFYYQRAIIGRVIPEFVGVDLDRNGTIDCGIENLLVISQFDLNSCIPMSEFSNSDIIQIEYEQFYSRRDKKVPKFSLFSL